MLSDEITTGSVTTSDADKRAYAARSHSWNITQKKFKEMFPEVSHTVIAVGCGRAVSKVFRRVVPHPVAIFV